MGAAADTLAHYAAIADRELEQALAGDGIPDRLLTAMRYSVFPGGKRLRPVLALAAAEAVSGDWRSAVPSACAVELIHCCSLVHDDLPCMDDDDERRGRPSCHVRWGEALALLAGTALLTLAFERLAAAAAAPGEAGSRQARAALEIARAAGAAGMIGGQALDIAAVGQQLNGDELDRINLLKTGALIRGAVISGALAAGASPTELDAMAEYGEQLGRCFQLTDDLLDAERDRERVETGRANPGYPAVMGWGETYRLARITAESAIGALVPLGSRGEFLGGLAIMMVNRGQ